MRRSSIATAALLLAGGAHAMTGQELLQLYDSNKPAALRYIYGVVDGGYFTRDFMEDTAKVAQTHNQWKASMRNLWGCAYGQSSQRIGEVVYAHILRKPEDQRSLDSVVHIAIAVSSEWPCQ